MSTESKDTVTPSGTHVNPSSKAVRPQTRGKAAPKAKAPRKRRSQTWKKSSQLVDAREAREQAQQDLGIGMRVLFLCGLPLKSLAETYYERRCGVFTLSVLGHPKYGGVPYGQDRLIPIWIATAFVHLGCPADNTLEFACARDILRTFQLPTDGPHYQRLREGLLRFSHASFTITQEVRNKRGGKGVSFQHLPMLRSGQLWYEDPHAPTPVTRPGDLHRLVLDEQWAKEIREHSVPIDMLTVIALRNHPGALDFYQWQAYRSYLAKQEIRVPLQGKHGLIAQLGCLQGQSTREIRRRIKEWQKLIKISWPTCPNGLSRDGKEFVIRPGKAITHSYQNRFLLRGLPGTPK